MQEVFGGLASGAFTVLLTVAMLVAASPVVAAFLTFETGLGCIDAKGEDGSDRKKFFGKGPTCPAPRFVS